MFVDSNDDAPAIPWYVYTYNKHNTRINYFNRYLFSSEDAGPHSAVARAPDS